MGTFSDLRTSIANDLSRTDLDSQTKSAVVDAIKAYEPERFWFNQSRATTFPTVAGQNIYTSSAFTGLPRVIEYDHIFLRDATSQWELCKQEAGDFEWMLGTNTANGRPTDYTYIDSALFFWPTPNAVYTARCHAHFRELAYPSADADTSMWFDNAENLIRAHAKMILYANVLEDDQGAARMQAQVPYLLGKLFEETTSRMATGRIRATVF